MKRTIPTPLVMVDYFSEKLKLYGFRARIASAVLNKKAGKYMSVLDHIDLSLDVFRHIPLKYVGWPILPMQLKQEIHVLLTTLCKRKIRNMLEIGTASGGTLFLFTRVIDENARIISLDLPGGKFGGGYEGFKSPFFTNFAQGKQKIFLVRSDSHSSASLLAIKAILKNRKLDFLFIDGDHTYNGVKKDFEMYSPLVRRQGLIAFHDICKGPFEIAGNVNKFWNEIKHGYQYREIVSDCNQKGFGIGILYV